MQQGVVTNLVVECCQLGRRRKLTINQKVGDLDEGRIFGDILDRIAAVAQDSLVAIDERDVRGGRRRVHKSTIQRGQTRLTGQRRDVDCRRPVRCGNDGEFRDAAGVVQLRSGGRVVSHGRSSLM